MSIRFQADNDLNFGIVTGVRRREPAIDFVSAQEAGLNGVADPDLLERAAREQRVLVSHDRRTIIPYFHDRLAAGKSGPGLLIASQSAPIGEVVDALIQVWSLAGELDLRDQVFYLPSLSRHVFRR